jgi:hypothetical protein
MRLRPICALAAIAGFAAITATATPASARSVQHRPLDDGPDCYGTHYSGYPRHHSRIRPAYNLCDGLDLFGGLTINGRNAPHLGPGPLPSGVSQGFAGKRVFRR